MAENFSNAVSETALLTVFLKAEETIRPDRIINDPKSIEILEKLNADLSRFKNKTMSQVGTAIRVRTLDREVKRFTAENQSPVVVNLACGLDARFLRTDTGKGIQIDIDLPDVMEVRKKFFPPSERNPQISASILETKWMDEILTQYPGRQFAFVMEGVLMYFCEDDVKKLFASLIEKFPGAELYFDTVSKFIVRHSESHDTLKEYKGKVIFSWGINDPREIENWNPALKFMGAENYMTQELRRWGVYALINLIPPFVRGTKVLHYDIAKNF